jgi:light-regulated signal transduction histidine kinase (bacteriophytochrome)
VASHDCQEPLRMVSFYIDLLDAEYGDELDDEADDYIEYAFKAAERMQAKVDGCWSSPASR